MVFEKDISMHKEDLLRYEVRENEHLYQIMRSFGLNNEQIAHLMPEIRKLNPHIENLSRLEPGQKLVLPVLESSRKAVSKQMERWKAEPIQAKVRAGESLVSMLRRIGKVPHHLIFNEYLNLFRDLNPDIQNIDRLKPGQSVTLPVYSPQATNKTNNGTKQLKRESAGGKDTKKGSGKASTSVQTKNPSKEKSVSKQAVEDKKKEKKDEKHDGPNPLQARCLSALEVLGLKEIEGESMFLPKKDGNWLRIDLQATPVIKGYSGQKILFSEKKHVNRWKRELANTDIAVCPAFDWNINKILEWVGNKSGKAVHIWKHERPFSVSLGDLSLEFKADLIAKIRGRGLHIVNFVSSLERSTGDMVQNLLRSLGIAYSEFLIRKSSDIRSTFEKLPLSSIFIPEKARGYRVVQNGGDGSQSEKRLPRDELSRKDVRLTLLQQAKHKMTLYLSLPADKQGRLVLNGEKANPYLFALLNMHGYDCLIAR